MSHLKIEQNTSSVEVISSTIIDKLYELAQSGTLDSSSNLKGNLQVTHAYEDAVTYLTTNYANLQINVTGGAYIRFADSAVAAICASNWGDGVGITKIQAAVVTDFSDKFAGKNIKTFKELTNFVNLKMEYNETSFIGSSIEYIDLSNITKVGTLGNYYSYVFYNCTQLGSVVFSDNLESIGSLTFNNCSKFNSKLPTSIKYLGSLALANTAYSYDVNLPNLIDVTSDKTNIPNEITGWLMDGWFGYTQIERVTNLGSITRISRNKDNFCMGCFEGCPNLKYVTLPATLQTIGCRTFSGDSALIYIKCLAITPPTIQSSLWLDGTNSSFKIYVPDDSVDAYKVASYWSTYASRIFSLTQFAMDFPNG